MANAYVAFVVRVRERNQADIGDFVTIGYDLARKVQQDVGGSADLMQVAKSDSRLVPDVYAAVPETTNPVSARSGTVTHVSATIAGAGAGNHTVTGIKTTDELVAVVHVDDTTHVGTDKTSEYTISAADTVNNTSGTSSASNHVVVAYRRV